MNATNAGSKKCILETERKKPRKQERRDVRMNCLDEWSCEEAYKKNWKYSLYRLHGIHQGYTFRSF